MKQKKRQKLALRRDIVRVLQDQDLARAVAGTGVARDIILWPDCCNPVYSA